MLKTQPYIEEAFCQTPYFPQVCTKTPQIMVSDLHLHIPKHQRTC